jgi:hypothetical protein
MLSKDATVKVRNRSYGTVGYSIPEMRIQRKFQKNETKEVTMEELRKLSFQPGGQELINQFLVVEDKQALSELNPNFEPEYFYTEKDIERMLLTASIEEFLDCLDFAPEGVIGLLKTKAVELEIPDIRKRDAIFKKTGYNINRQIQLKQEAQEEDAAGADIKQRRVAIPTETPEPEAPVRRASAPAENVAEAFEEKPATAAPKYSIKK